MTINDLRIREEVNFLLRRLNAADHAIDLFRDHLGNGIDCDDCVAAVDRVAS